MIVRDEAAMLPGCLASVQGAVDEICIVDTGSTDDTVAIAEAHGAKVVHRAWDDDFSAARNRSLQLASAQWVLVLDADERLTPAASARLRTAVGNADFDCGMLPLHNADALDADLDAVVAGHARIAEVAYLPRLLRRTDDLRYTGIVHENVGDWLAKDRVAKLVSGVDIVHLGGVPSLRQRRDKAARNTKLLERYVATHPDDVTPYGYLAHEHHEAGNREAALEVSGAGWKLIEDGATATDLSVLRLATAHAWLMLSRGDMDVAIRVCERALADMPRHPDLYFLRGCAHEAAGLRAPTAGERRARLTAALDDYERARRRDGHLVLQKFVDGCTTWAAETRRGTAYLCLGEPARALTAFDEALAFGAHDEARWGKAESLIGVGKPKDALALVKHDLSDSHLSDRPGPWVVAALCAEAMGELEMMMTMVARAQAALSAGFVSPHRRERYVDVLALASIYANQPAPMPGPLGQLSGVLAGRFEATEGATARPLDADAARRALSRATAAQRNRLQDARAHELCPWLEEVLA